ncbi:MAG TPA: (2Fe-2S)-binding protein [Bacillota bacterium]|nr:(2Fe-2S)-binding protein [Bacillota bacterium]
MANVNFVLNHTPVAVEGGLNRRLLDVLRTDFGLKGPKEGCGEGECGACAVLIDHRIVNSCLMPLASCEGKDIVTIEGFSETERFTVLQKAYSECGAVQCGFCTPGMILASESLLHANPHPTEEEVRIGLSGNLCRCTGYNMIVKAVLLAAKEGEGLW